MKRIKLLAILGLIPVLLCSTAVSAEELTQSFKTKEEAQQWIDENTKDTKYTYETSIEEKTISGVTAELTDEDGYHISDIYDDYDKSTGGFAAGETITITGGKQDIKIDPDTFEYNGCLPGYSGTITIKIKNTSGDIYQISDAQHINGHLYQYDSSGEIDFNPQLIINRLNTMDPTVRAIFKEDGIPLSNKNVKIYITEERLLKYYNSINGTSFDSLYDAWSYNFFNRCWSLTYNKDLSSLNVDDDTYIVTWSIDGENTDNAYQMTAWNWTDTLSITCPDVIIYEAYIKSTEKEEKKEEQKEKEKSENKDKKDNSSQKQQKETKKTSDALATGDETSDTPLFILLGAILLVILLFLAI